MVAGGLVGSLIPEGVIKVVASLAFMFFAITTLMGDDEGEEELVDNKIKFAPIAVLHLFCGRTGR